MATMANDALNATMAQMPRPTLITSLTNPRVKEVVKLRRHRTRRTTGLFLAEGLREVGRAVQAGLRLRELYLCPELLADHAVTWDADRTFEVPADVLVKMTYHRQPEGVLAVVEEPDGSLEAMPTVDLNTRILVAVGTEKPGNLGAMVRTACAAGFDAVIASGQSVEPFNPNAIRASTGGVFVMPIVVMTEHETIHWIEQHQLRVIAATPAGAIDYRQADWSGPLALAIGAEDAGLSDAWLRLADNTHGQRVALPNAHPWVDSLNASVAAGVLMYEATRD